MSTARNFCRYIDAFYLKSIIHFCALCIFLTYGHIFDIKSRIILFENHLAYWISRTQYAVMKRWHNILNGFLREGQPIGKRQAGSNSLYR